MNQMSQDEDQNEANTEAIIIPNELENHQSCAAPRQHFLDNGKTFVSAELSSSNDEQVHSSLSSRSVGRGTIETTFELIMDLNLLP
jgi:hypothetical protein